MPSFLRRGRVFCPLLVVKRSMSTMLSLSGSEDAAIWSYAIHVGAVIVTKDDDFVKQSHLSQIGPAIVWLRVGNTGKRELLRWFERLLPEIEVALSSGERVVEVI